MVSIVDAKRWCTGDLTMMKTCRTYGAPLSALILFATNLMSLQRNRTEFECKVITVS